MQKNEKTNKQTNKQTCNLDIRWIHFSWNLSLILEEELMDSVAHPVVSCAEGLNSVQQLFNHYQHKVRTLAANINQSNLYPEQISFS